MGRKSPNVSLQEIAEAVGLSKAAVGFALNNRPGVSVATRERVLKAAKKMGYIPDARVSSVMTTVRASRSKQLLPIAWLNTNSEEDAWRRYTFHTPYLEGAREAALNQGFRLEEIWAGQPGITMQRISTILYQRGIEGAIISYPAKHFRLKWDKLAAVSLEGALLAPKLHRVMTDHFFNISTALKYLKRAGHRRIGIAVSSHLNRLSNHSVNAAVHAYHATIAANQKVPLLIYADDQNDSWKDGRKSVGDWVRAYRPEVIVCQANWMVECLERLGLRVPRDVGVVQLATDDDLADSAGICSNRREIGAAAADLVIALVHARHFGVPRTALSSMVRGVWKPGWTLAAPARK